MRGNISWRAVVVLSVLGAVIAIGAGSAQAGPLVYEPFDYTVGQYLTGRNGGIGFTGAWAATTGNATIREGSLSWGTLPVSGGYAQVTSRVSQYRLIDSSLANAGLLDNGSTLWFSFVYDLLGQTNTTNLDYCFALSSEAFEGNYSYKTSLRNSGVGIGFTTWRGQMQGAYWQDDNLDTYSESHTADTTLKYTSTPLNNVRALIVGKIEWGAASDANETLTLYAPGADLALGTPILNPWSIPALDQSVFDTIAWQGKDIPSIDEIRFGATYEDVIVFPTLSWDLNGATAGAGADGAGAAPGTWDGATSNWNLMADGTGTTGTWLPGYVASFAAGSDATGTYTVTVEGTQDIWGLTFEEGDVTLAPGTGGQLRLTKEEAPVDVASGRTATVATPITEDAAGRALTKKGAGTLILSGANSYTGGTTVGAGTLRLGASGALPSGTAVTVAGNAAGVTATLDLDGNSFTIAGLTLGGATTTSAAAVTTGAGTLTLGGDVTYDSANDPAGAEILGKLSLGSAARTFTVGDSTSTAAELTVSADVSGSGGMVKEGAGALALSGDNSAATGGMTINGGAVRFDSAASINGAGSNVTVNLGGAVAFGASFGAANVQTALADRIVTSSAGAIAADNYAGEDFDFATLGFTAASLGASGSVTYTGTLTPNGTTYRLGGGGGTLTMANANAVTGAGKSLVVVGPGTVVLSAANDYDGTTTIQSGTLQPNDANALGSGGDITFTGGALQYSAASTGLDWNSRIKNSTGAVNFDTNGQTVTLTGVIDGSNTGGLSKLGEGSLTLDAANAYTGVTTVQAGTLTAGAGQASAFGAAPSFAFGPGSTGKLQLNGNSMTVSGLSTDAVPGTPILENGAAGDVVLTVNSAADSTFAGILQNGSTGKLGLTKSGAGTLALTAANTFTGGFTLNGGTVDVGHNNALGANVGKLTFNSGTLSTSGGRTINSPVDLAGDIAVVGTNNFTFQTGAWTLVGGSRALDVASGRTLTVKSVIGDGGNNYGLTKTGAGTLTLNASAANTFTGGLAVKYGTLLEDFGSMGTPTDLVDSTNVLTLGGGTLSLKAKSNVASSQTFASTTLDANTASMITLTKNGTGIMSVDLKAITRNAGSVLNFTVVPDTTNVFAATTNANTNDILGPWATVGATTALQYAANNGSNQIVALGAAGTTPATPATAGTLANMTSATTNYEFAAAATIPDANNLTGNTLRYTGGAATLDIGADANTTNTLTLNGLMNAGTGALTVARSDNGPDATGGLVVGDSNELVIVTNNQGVTISCPIMNNSNGPGAVTFASYGGGLTLSGVNTYSGGTVVSAGALTLGLQANSALGTGPLTLNPGTQLNINRNTLSIAVSINDATIAGGNSFGTVFSGPVTVTGVATLLAATGTGNIDYTGDISGPGAVRSLGSREDSQLAVDLFGTNTFAGPAIIGPNANMRFNKRVSLPNTGSWTEDNLVVEAGGAAYFKVGGTGEFTAADIDMLAALGTDTGGFKNGSYLGLENGGTFSYTSVIADTNGGANKLGFKKFGGGTLTLGDNNTYTGPTYLHAGTTVVSSLNSVVGGTASSSLGAPKTVADGTIVLNPYSPTITLRYVGTGETTDRMINSKGSNLIIDQSGTGLLKFTGDIAGTNNTATFTLRGSTDGTGEFAGSIGGTRAARIVKTGTGTWTLSGTNLYTGTTTVNGGTLLINGDNSAATGAVTVAAAGRLGGGGTIGGAVTVNGTLAPGASIGTLTVGTETGPNNLAMAATSAYEWQLGASAADMVVVTGDLTFEDGWKLKLFNDGGTPSGEYDLFTYDGFLISYAEPDIDYGTTGWTSGDLTVKEASGRIYLSFGIPGDTNNDGVVDAADFITVKKNFGAGVGGGASVGNFDNTGTVDWADLSILMENMGATSGAPGTAPEPATLGLLALGALAVVRRRTRK